MIYLVISLILFAGAWYHYLTEKITKFRNQLHPGESCSVLIDNKYYEAEVEDITGTTVFVVFVSNTQVTFNNKCHITDIYPSRIKK